MKETSKLVMLAALVFTLAGATTYAQSPPEGSDQPPGPPPGHPRLGQVLTDLLQKYDVNHDGQLDQTEMAALRKDIADGKIEPPRPPGGPGPGALPKEILDRYDLNKDGHLDETERAALRKDIEDGKIQPPARRGPQGQPGPGLGAPPTPKEILAKYDVDKDGKLDETELRAFLADLPRHRLPPPGMRHPGGPGGPPPGNEPGQ